jgi:two-component system response regulator TtrR
MNASLRTLYVVDDDEAVRRSLGALLVSRGYGVQPFESGERFLVEADTARHGCVVLDLRMAGLSGLQVFDALRERGSPLVVLFLSGHGDIGSAVQAVQSGAAGWLEKPCADEAFLAKVEQAIARAAAADAADRDRRDAQARWLSLTPREREVATLVARGRSNKEVARLLDPPCGLRSVEAHRARAFEKLAVSNAAELANFARDHPIDWRTGCGMEKG